MQFVLWHAPTDGRGGGHQLEPIEERAGAELRATEAIRDANRRYGRSLPCEPLADVETVAQRMCEPSSRRGRAKKGASALRTLARLGIMRSVDGSGKGSLRANQAAFV